MIGNLETLKPCNLETCRVNLETLCLLLVLVFCGTMSVAQNATGAVRGLVTDPSGAVVAQAKVSVIAPNGQALTAATDSRGNYEVKGLRAGNYTVTAVAPGFSPFAQQDVSLVAGQLQQFNIALDVAVQQEHVQVEDEATTLDVASDNNASAIVIKDKDLDALSDDPDELQSELEALAGPSAGPNGGQIYIDGFSNGQLPPKSSIREIRVNQNPFSPEYDKLGYGRVEVFTKPGTDNLHGRFFFNDNDSSLNSRNPFLGTAAQPGYHTYMYEGNIGGPLNKQASYFFNFERRTIGDLSIVNATEILGEPYTQAVPNPKVRTEISPRLDYQLTPSNTMTVRYQYNSNSEDNDGVGQTALASQAYNLRDLGQRLQVSDTQVVNTQTVNETRFQYSRDHNNELSLDSAPAIQVPGSFTAGGNPIGNLTDHNDRAELQNYTSRVMGKHILKFGGRLRVSRDANYSSNNLNGTYVFPSLSALTTLAAGPASALTPVPSLCAGNNLATESMNSTLATQCQASQYSSTLYIQPMVRELWTDAGVYVGDDWRIRPQLTLSYGMRLETQSDISDHADYAPRIGMAWGLGRGKSAPKTVLRVGSGIFYDRFTQDLIMQAERMNGVLTQPQITTYPSALLSSAPPVPLATSIIPVRYQVAPNLRAPYTIQTGVTLERQITKVATASLTYLNSRGNHVLDIRNINTPGAASYISSAGNIYQYESEGIFKQNQLIANTTIRMGAKLSLFGYYTYGHANSDTSGSGSFPFYEDNLIKNYGRASFDVRDRLFLGGSVGMPYNFRLSPFLIASSGMPFNITTNTDINGDSIIGNDRPYFNGISSCGGTPVKGDFSTTPTYPNQPAVPVNCGTGSPQFSLNLRVAKTFGFGKKAEQTANASGGGDHGGHGGRPPGMGMAGGGGPMNMGSATNQRYNVTFSVSARNLLNFISPAAPIGNIDSPRFEQPIALAGGPSGGPFGSSSSNRRIDLQVMFSF
jgi:hypothetical protein